MRDRNPGLLPDEEGYLPDDDSQIEIIEVPNNAALCAFILTDVSEDERVSVDKQWAEVVGPAAAESMQRFVHNLRGD